MAGAAYLGGAIGFDGENITRLSKQSTPKGAFILKAIGALLGLAAFITDIVLVAPNLQNPETGDFDITGIAATNFTAFAIVTAAGIIGLTFFFILSHIKTKNN